MSDNKKSTHAETGQAARSSEQPSKRLTILTADFLKWLVVILSVMGAIVANFCFSAVAWPIRASVGILLCVALVFLSLQTVKGQRAWVFIQSARAELRKVGWPTRQETVQLTTIVVVVVIIAALILWGLDGVFMGLISWLTGQRG